MLKIHQYTMLCAPTVGQFAAVEALKHGIRAVRDMRNEYKRRRNYLVKNLNDIGLSCHMPQGAFYVFPSIKKTGIDSRKFAKLLLDEEKVAVVPGTAFGPAGEGYLRMAYPASFDNIKEALYRIRRFINRHKLL
jgi:aminotransferase